MLVSVAVLALTRLSMAALEADLQATASDLVDMEGSLSPLEARVSLRLVSGRSERVDHSQTCPSPFWTRPPHATRLQLDAHETRANARDVEMNDLEKSKDHRVVPFYPVRVNRF